MDEDGQKTSAPLDPAEIHFARVESKRRSRRRLLAIATVLGLTVGYVLSPGWIVLLDRHGLLPGWSEPITQTLMFPLAWAHNRSPFISELYKTYFWLIGADL